MGQMEFIADLDGQRVFWRTESANDYDRDFSAGRRYGRQLVESIRTRQATPFILAEVIAAFPDQLSPIERGFLSEVGYALLAA